MTDRRIKIPHTDLSLFPLGYGTVDIGLKKTEMSEITAVLEAYLQMGGNVIDTARVYSDWVPPLTGRSETILGQWIKARGHHNDFVLISKGGHPRLDTMHTPRMSLADMRQDLENSLRTLGIDCIDVYFYHRDDCSIPAGELLENMEVFRREGKIRYYGCSNWTTSRMKEAESYAREHGLRGFVANQMLFNIGSRYKLPHDDDTMVAMDDEMLRFHRECPDNLAMPYFGLCSGFFHRLDSLGDEAVKNDLYYTPGNLEVKRRIDRIRQEAGVSLTQALLGFFYSQDFPVLPLVFSSSLSHLEDAMAAVEKQIDPALYQF